jgi:hypothetical protein
MKRAQLQSGALTIAQAGLVTVMEKVRELSEWGRKSGWGSPAMKILDLTSTAPRPAPSTAPASTVSNVPDPARARAAAEADMRTLVMESDTVSGINARFDQELHKLNDGVLKLQVAGGFDATAQVTYQQLISDAYLRRRMALEALAQKGVASQQSEIDALKKRADLEVAAAANYYELQADSLKRALDLEDSFHQLGLVGEREYIDRKADLQRDAAQNSVNRLTGEIQAQEHVLAELRDQLKRAPTPTASTQIEGQISEQEKKIGDARKDLTIVTRSLGDVEVKRDRDQILYGKQVEQQFRSEQRAKDDFVQSIAREQEQLALEIDMIDKSELVQAKANAQLALKNKFLDEEQRLRRKIEDLETTPGSNPAVIEKLKNDLVELAIRAAEAGVALDALLEKQFRKESFKRVGDAIAEALVDGGKDAGKQIFKAIEDEFKKKIKVELSNSIQGSLEDIFSGKGFDISRFANAGTYGAIGGLAAGGIAGAAGAGPRGQQAAVSYGAAGTVLGAEIGSIFPVVGTAIGAVIGGLLGTIAGYFTDPSGPAPVHGRFGSMTPDHNDSRGYWQPGGGGRSSPFGQFGFFDDSWMSVERLAKPIHDFLDGLAQADALLARMLHPGELGAVQSALAGSHEYNFGTEGSEDVGGTLSRIVRDRMSAMIEAVMPGFGRLIAAASGTGEDFINMAQALLGLRDAGKAFDDAIADITDTVAEKIANVVSKLDARVQAARGAFDSAVEAQDPVRIYAAEQELATAIMDRYNKELEMVNQLRDALQQMKEEAFQFQLAIAQKINGVGGSIDIGALALGHASQLRAGVGGTYNPAGQLRDVNSYVGAIDAWYQARRSAIERQMAADQAAAQAIAQAQQSAAQARLGQLQNELDLAKQFQGVLDRSRGMINDMRLSGSNPASIYASPGHGGRRRAFASRAVPRRPRRRSRGPREQASRCPGDVSIAQRGGQPAPVSRVRRHLQRDHARSHRSPNRCEDVRRALRGSREPDPRRAAAGRELCRGGRECRAVLERCARCLGRGGARLLHVGAGRGRASLQHAGDELSGSAHGTHGWTRPGVLHREPAARCGGRAERYQGTHQDFLEAVRGEPLPSGDTGTTGGGGGGGSGGHGANDASSPQGRDPPP